MTDVSQANLQDMMEAASPKARDTAAALVQAVAAATSGANRSSSGSDVDELPPHGGSSAANADLD